MRILSTSDARLTRLAVLGSPIDHSRSPQLHRAAYDVLGLDWDYGRHRVDSSELDGFIAGLDDDWRGLSLTMPLKTRAFELAGSTGGELDRRARVTGAVNTLAWDRAGGLLGFNTDVAGLVHALADEGVARATHVTVLGGGATAASAIAAAAELGAEEVQLLLRDPARGEALAGLAASVGLRLRTVAFDGAEIVESTLVVSTLPGGARPPIDLPESLRAAALLFDVSYDPWPSAVAQQWALVGGRAVGGTGMLVHQALLQVRVFVGGDPELPLPDEDAVLAAMRAAAR
ncbi:shikimate dehydrogenase [Glaciibacter flavus]|uniref:Shikimate dehydrogenase n=1 Tax=Orlajensenia flava TaxID=2565934 RepID=A0A4S4FZ28_9MICO|nr:shikimate dehydrogenase [Glaciibacter flavus]THG35315.1 shikimate dehydrogenase [Glaciibacter flavus]